LRRSRNAFSILETLVAVFILTLLITTAVYSFRFVLLHLSKQEFSGIDRLLSYTQLRASLESMRYYVVDDYDAFLNSMNDLHYFFKGEEAQMNYITQNPIFSDSIAVVKLECKEQKLLYTEEPLYGRIDFTQPDVLQDSAQRILFENLVACRFLYRKDGQTLTSLQRNLPTSVELKLATHNQTFDFYIDIRTDHNISKAYIQSVPDEF